MLTATRIERTRESAPVFWVIDIDDGNRLIVRYGNWLLQVSDAKAGPDEYLFEAIDLWNDPDYMPDHVMRRAIASVVDCSGVP